MADPQASVLLEAESHTVDEDRWVDVEAELGLRFPHPYKVITERWGARHWNGFASAYDPLSEGYQALIQEVMEAEHETRSKYPYLYPLPLHPEPGGLYPWAGTDNGDVLFWITSCAVAEWPTLVKGPRAPEFEVHFGPCHLLLYRIAAGIQPSAILAADY